MNSLIPILLASINIVILGSLIYGLGLLVIFLHRKVRDYKKRF